MGPTDPSNGITVSGAPSAASRRLLPWLVAFAFFMESLDTTILNTAVPAISAALHVGAPQHESRAGQLYVESRRVHPYQRLGRGPIRNAPCVRRGNRTFYPGLILVRHIEQHPCTRRLPHSAGLRRLHDGARRPAHPGADVREIRSSPHHELRFDTGPDCSHAWTHRGRSDCRTIFTGG